MDVTHQFVTVFCCHCGHVLTVPVYCRNRFCPVCTTARRLRVRSKLTGFIKVHRCTGSYGYKHLTLTIKNQPDLKVMVKSLSKSFRRLRQRQIWKKNVRGGVFVVEITRKDSGWHAHLHIIIEAKYMVYSDLLAAWEAVSLGSGVYIRRIPPGQIVRYLTKYITKSELGIEYQRVASEALKGTRLFQPFGTWHNPIQAIQLELFKCPDCERTKWVFGSFDAFFRKCEPGDISDFPTEVMPSRPPSNRQLMLIPATSTDQCVRR